MISLAQARLYSIRVINQPYENRFCEKLTPSCLRHQTLYCSSTTSKKEGMPMALVRKNPRRIWTKFFSKKYYDLCFSGCWAAPVWGTPTIWGLGITKPRNKSAKNGATIIWIVGEKEGSAPHSYTEVSCQRIVPARYRSREIGHAGSILSDDSKPKRIFSREVSSNPKCNNQSPKCNHQSPKCNHQSPKCNHQSPKRKCNHQSPKIKCNHQSPPPAI